MLGPVHLLRRAGEELPDAVDVLLVEGPRPGPGEPEQFQGGDVQQAVVQPGGEAGQEPPRQEEIGVHRVAGQHRPAVHALPRPPRGLVHRGGQPGVDLPQPHPRVDGALAAGWTIDWVRWVQLAADHWVANLGVDAWAFFCSDEQPCEWTDTDSFAQFVFSTVADPGDCGGAPCVGTGEHWLRQIDLRHLIEAGAFEGKALALVRNGREAHQIELESRAFDEGVTVDQFLFLPESGHVQNTPPHSAMWRHWVRHVLTDVPTPTVTAVQHEGTVAAFSVSAQVEGADTVVSAELWLRPSYDGTFGSLDAIAAYAEQCAAANTCASWQRVPLDVAQDSVTVARFATGFDAGTNIAYVVHVTFDDGSGDHATVSSAAKFATLP